MFKKRDLVCGVKVGRNTEYFTQFGGKHYYFDSQACRETFIERPQGFIRQKSGDGFLSWIAKGSKDVPQSCHECRIKRQ